MEFSEFFRRAIVAHYQQSDADLQNQLSTAASERDKHFEAGDKLVCDGLCMVLERLQSQLVALAEERDNALRWFDGINQDSPVAKSVFRVGIDVLFPALGVTEVQA